MEIGVYGGTFDPVHLGHLIIAEEARLKLNLEKVLFAPARNPWMKAKWAISSPRRRLAMLKLAIRSNPFFHISTVDLENPGPSFTVNTLSALKKEYGDSSNLYFILGVDSLRDVPYWRDPHNIVKYGKMVAMPRPGFEALDWDVLEKAVPNARDNITLLNGPLIDISSTEVRRRVSQGMSIRYLVPEAVESYIYETGLYRPSRQAGPGSPPTSRVAGRRET